MTILKPLNPPDRGYYFRVGVDCYYCFYRLGPYCLATRIKRL